jgi:predicted transcriptional regulator
MTARTINVRLPEALYNQIEELAKATARTKSFLAMLPLGATSYQVKLGGMEG